MNYLEKLKDSAKKNNSIVCMGLDPVIKAIPQTWNPENIPYITDFIHEIFLEMKKQNVLPGAFKPNQGFYVELDNGREKNFNGSSHLANIMNLIEKEFPGTPIILDPKRGDIAKSSANYAVEGFESWRADAVTVSPYMGTDSVGPFAEYCNDERGKGVYVLNRTSNKGAKDFQNLEVVIGDKVIPLYMVVANKIIEWSKDHPGVGAVVGATSPDELSDLAKLYAGKDIPLLIPGVGGQGGSGKVVRERILDAGYDPSLARISSSSGITHPWAKKKEKAPEDFAKVCVEELNKLNEQISYKP